MADQPYHHPGLGIRRLLFENIEPVERRKAALTEEPAEAVLAEPVHGGIDREVGQFRPGGFGQSLITTFQETGVPAVQRQAELHLAGAQTACRGKVQHPARAHNSDGLFEAELPILDVFEKFRQAADIEGFVGEGEFGRRTDAVIELEGCRPPNREVLAP